MIFRKRHVQPVPERESAAELAASLARLEETRRQVIAPLHRLREQNNVSELVGRLISEGKGRRGRGAAAG